MGHLAPGYCGKSVGRKIIPAESLLQSHAIALKLFRVPVQCVFQTILKTGDLPDTHGGSRS